MIEFFLLLGFLVFVVVVSVCCGVVAAFAYSCMEEMIEWAARQIRG